MSRPVGDDLDVDAQGGAVFDDGSRVAHVGPGLADARAVGGDRGDPRAEDVVERRVVVGGGGVAAQPAVARAGRERGAVFACRGPRGRGWRSSGRWAGCGAGWVGPWGRVKTRAKARGVRVRAAVPPRMVRAAHSGPEDPA
ncbi:hypothetical protein GCM10010440_75270 [Kitasatospora cinereorecta]